MVDKEELIRFTADQGFIWGPEPEIYGGLAGFYSYGPLGKLLKNKVENSLRKSFAKYGFWEVECPTVMPAPVWKASGHLGGFSDPLIQCSKCNGEFRVDKLLEEKLPEVNIDYGDKKKLLAVIKGHHLKCELCKSDFKDEIIDHNLMMQTTIGVDREAYNRPETATVTYLPFKRYYKHFRTKLPFGVFQIGKAYRNEISPRQHTIRGREFTQAEAQFFMLETMKDNWDIENIKNVKLPIWTSELQKANKEPQEMTIQECIDKGIFTSKAYAWTVHIAFEYFKNIGLTIRLREHHEDERAFYAKDAWDCEINTNSFGWIEACGVHDRTNYDLQQHGKESGEDLTINVDGNKVFPHVLEIAFGPDRIVFALLDHYYDGKKLKIPADMAPVQVGVYPLLKNKEELIKKAKEVYDKLKFRKFYDESGSIGRRYARADQVGIPIGVTIDFDTLKDDTVTVRDRDTTEQVRVKVSELGKEIGKRLNL